MLVLTDDQRGAGRPTKENLLKALDWLVRDAKRGDALFFHYSGHGGQEDDPDGIKYHELMDALHRELRRKRMSQKPQLSSSQRFDLRGRVFCLTDGFVPNGNANLGRPPRQPGHRPHRKHGQAMGGMNLEDFLAGGGGGMAMAAMGGLLLSMALGDH